MQKGIISSDFIVKSKQKHNTVISGYASVFDIIDSQNDVIIKGAFKNTNKDKVKLLWQHDVSKPIGVITLLKEDEYGLLIEAEINNKTISGNEAIELVKQKAVAGLSVGFSIKSSDYDKDGSRIIQDVELMEISIVTFPSNKQAEIQQIKHNEYDKDKLFLEHERITELSKLIKQIELY